MQFAKRGRENTFLPCFFLIRMAGMKPHFPICSILLISMAAAHAQVASHAPTALAQPPASVQAAQAPARPVARVNGSVLTDVDLVREEYTIFPYARQHGGLPKEMEPDIRKGAMKMLIFEELVYQEALRRKMVVSQVKLDHAEAAFRRTFASPDDFNAFVQSDFHGSLAQVREKIKRSLLIEALLKIEVEDKAVVSPVELKNYYDKNPDRFEHPEQYTFQTISILPPEKATADQLKEGRKRADDALKQAKATKTSEEFGLLAEKLSDDDFRVMMGQHKPTDAKQLAPIVLDSLKTMKPGDVSSLIQLDQAYTIVRLNEHKTAGEAKLAEVKAKLEKELPQTKREKLRSDLDAKLRENAKIEVL
jgi:parvulin-like peptidyl-prolyl isomerase